MNTNLGQLIITGISGPSLTTEEERFIKEGNVGGVIFFKHNYESPAQLAELANEIQSLRGDYPLYLSVDQEGGRVVRFRDKFTQFPSMLDLSKYFSPKDFFTMSGIVARQLYACGVNLNFAPCCDIFTNEGNKVIGDRAFGRDHETVCKFISSIIRGLQVNKVLACAKHFPGHGDTLKDSHFDLPYIKKTIEELQSVEIKPFVKAVQSKVEFIMMAHLVVDAFNEKYPSTLCPEAYDYIRNELKFNRLIITDDMQMNAILNDYTVEESSVMAIKSGADILCYRDSEHAEIALNALGKALEGRKLCAEQMNYTFKRIIESKKRNFINYTPIYIPEIEKMFRLSPTEEALLEKIESFNDD